MTDHSVPGHRNTVSYFASSIGWRTGRRVHEASASIYTSDTTGASQGSLKHVRYNSKAGYNDIQAWMDVGQTDADFNPELGYCPDTGYCENAVAIARDADLLIAECAFKSGENADNWPHLNPETAARIAREGNAKRLALVHFDAQRYPTLQDRNEAETVARTTFENTVATLDGMEIDV